MLRRDVRYQAAIIHADQVLLLKVVDRDSQATFWVLLTVVGLSLTAF